MEILLTAVITAAIAGAIGFWTGRLAAIDEHDVLCAVAEALTNVRDEHASDPQHWTESIVSRVVKNPYIVSYDARILAAVREAFNRGYEEGARVGKAES